jgi:CheY-like chemotaxis protein
MIAPPKSNVILMAEDDADDRLLAQDALLETGMPLELRFVEDGVQLLDYLNRKHEFSQPSKSPWPGLIILDLNMPRMDGREVLKELKSNPEWKKIPVVVLTTSTAEPDIERIYDLGANSYISKPVAFDALVRMMKSVADYWFKVVVPPGKI